MTENDMITLQQFARKEVIIIQRGDTIAKCIQLMYSNRIRHIPVVDNQTVVGVINPSALIGFILSNSEDLDFDTPVNQIISDNFTVTNPRYNLLDAVRQISEDPTHVFMIIEENSITGIFTEIDILDSDFLWLNMTDHPLTCSDEMGSEIFFDGSTSADRTILDTLKFMKEVEQNYITVTEGSNFVRGIIGLFSIIHHIYYRVHRQDKKPTDVLNETLHGIFPSSGNWYKEPILLSKVRSDMHVNNMEYALIMDKAHQGRRVLSVSDIVAYLVENSDYFDTSQRFRM